MSEPSPQERPFKIGFRGYEQAEVDRHLAELEAALQRTREERDRLASRLEQLGEKKHDFDALGFEVSQILNAAQEAAENLRKRATDEVALWRAEAKAEVDYARRSAAEDSEALRGDAWTASSQLIAGAQATAEQILKEAEREALAMTGQAERDAHRMTSNARREADEQVRLAKVEAERILVEARAERDEIVEAAQKSADQAQERARALEVRRNDLLAELESVRATVARLESDLEEKRQALSAVPRVVETVEEPEAQPEAEESEQPKAGDTEAAAAGGGRGVTWADETIRIIPAAKPTRVDPVDASAMADEVRRLKEEEPAAGPEPEVDVLAGLFDSLRAEGGSAPAPLVTLEQGVVDPFSLRDQLLLPITNRILRSVKRQLTDWQNTALEEINNGKGPWKPEVEEIDKSLHGDFVILAQESFAAGYSAAEAMTGESLGRPKPEAEDVNEQTGAFTSAIEADLTAGAKEASGARAAGAAVSRTFRRWRTDEAERRIREYARLAYHRGVARGLYALGMARMGWLVGSVSCDECNAQGNAGPMDVAAHLRKNLPMPPLHGDCSCTIVVSR